MTHYLDKLTSLVGQENAVKAVHLAEKVTEFFSRELSEAQGVIDGLREDLAAAEAKLEAADVEAQPPADDA